MNTLLLHFEDETAAAHRIASAAGMPCTTILRHRFPDGELKLTLPAELPERVVLLRTLDRPNEKLVELLLVARTARPLGAKHMTLVAPYLAYMRQDIAFNVGEVVSQRVIGAFLADLFDAVITVDPHLHRIAALNEAIPVTRAVALSGAPLLADLIAEKRPGALLLGPDEESAQWISQAASRHGFDSAVCRKTRHGDRAVEIELPKISLRKRAVVLLDDVASTGHTVAKAALACLAAGAASVDVAVTHALFADDALDVMARAGIEQVWSTDCIAHPTNAVSVAAMIAAELT